MGIRKLILTGLFAALTSVGALIAIPLPFSPVPVTLQSFFTLLAGVILGSRYGAMSQLVYLLLGGIGLPVFAGGKGGFQTFTGPTSGYLWGFVLAAFVIGLMTNKKSSVQKDLFAMLVGLIVMYVSGLVGLCLLTGMNLSTAIIAGVIPFFIGDLVKIIAVLLVNDQLRKRLPELYELRSI